jgi:hypothetical protein
MPTVDEHVDSILPFVEPTAEHVADAARLIAELVRRLNHVTIREGVLHYPAEVDAVVGALSGAASRLPQLLCQLGAAVRRLSREPGLYHDQISGHVDDPVVTALGALAYLDLAADVAGQLHALLSEAAKNLSRLGVR